MARPNAMTIATMPSMARCSCLGRFEIAGGILRDGDVGCHPAGYWIPAMGELLRNDQLLELARGRRHRAEALAELDHRGTLVLEPERDVGGVPGVVRDLADPEEGASMQRQAGRCAAYKTTCSPTGCATPAAGARLRPRRRWLPQSGRGAGSPPSMSRRAQRWRRRVGSSAAPGR
jgi:hypothetical protein